MIKKVFAICLLSLVLLTGYCPADSVAASNVTKEEIYINEIKFFGADIIIGYCINETDDCGDLLIPADSALYDYVADNEDILFHVFWAEITDGGNLISLTPYE